MISSVSSFSAGLPQPIDLGVGTHGLRNTLEATPHGHAPGADQPAESDAAPVEPSARHELSTQAIDNQSAEGLSDEERAAIAELQQTDREVRAHERAHLAAAGGLARGVSFTFVTGPDGQQYAVGGEVSIDSSPVSGNPERTIQKAQQIRAAANARQTLQVRTGLSQLKLAPWSRRRGRNSPPSNARNSKQSSASRSKTGTAGPGRRPSNQRRHRARLGSSCR